ncbi:patatin-like phospholipase family protein [Sphingomonas pituitosa]|uniref:patatin-like phospholipase family protein n=1 Tax=Sphingomonas pituitosa TaxID=99597 RepID=UPI0008356A74|nr:patatin-like phospholipase family protein [Sphingomonas pituitosa]
MKILRSVVAVVAAGLSLAGCTQPRPKPIIGCNYTMLPISVSPAWQAKAVLPVAGDMLSRVTDRAADQLGSALRARRATRLRATAQPGALAMATEPDRFLALSGGGQHGAFGAGFFYGMAEKGGLPTWDIVTGVSTGSLQSTLLFLANQPVPGDRDYAAWVDGPLSGAEGATGFVVKPGTSNVGDLVLAYSILKEADLLRVRGGGAALGALLKGSSASFAPLRARLRRIISLGTLRAVAEEGQKNRLLLVGVSNLDDGKAYAIDLTALAAPMLAAGLPRAEAERIQGCYVDALLASSSVPPGVPPVTLQRRAEGAAAAPQTERTEMYMDGGARFGMFLQPVLRAFDAAGPGGKAEITLMVNTSMEPGSWSGTDAPMQRFSAVSGGLRAVDLLETQVYSFSAAQVEALGLEYGWLRMASLTRAPGGGAPQDHVFNGKSCAQWQAIDAKARPMQFYPWYMACTADYGRGRGAAQQWNHRVPTQP